MSHRTPFDHLQLGRVRGLGAAASVDATNPLAAALRASYTHVVIDSQVLPPITIPLIPSNEGPTVGQQVGALASFIKPRITLTGPAGNVSFAPQGVPNTSLAPIVTIGTMAAIFGMGWILGRAQKRRQP